MDLFTLCLPVFGLDSLLAPKWEGKGVPPLKGAHFGFCSHYLWAPPSISSLACLAELFFFFFDITLGPISWTLAPIRVQPHFFQEVIKVWQALFPLS